MLQGINGIYKNNDCDLAVPYIYTNGEWVRATPKGYINNNWLTLGAAGTLMIKFIISDGQEFYTSNGELFLVRDDPELISVSVRTNPNKTSYISGEYFDSTGLSFFATYHFHNRTYNQIIYNCDYENRPLTPNDTIFNVIVLGQNCSINLNIVRTLMSIEVTNYPNKKFYKSGDSFDPTGMIVVANYGYDDTILETEEITNYSYPTTMDKNYNGNFPISYMENNITKTIILTNLVVWAIGDIFNYPYIGEAQTITLFPGTYQLECWGAQGGYRTDATKGGKGGYAKGNLTITEDTVLYIYAGGSGNTGGTAGGFNGGGTRGTYPGGGGGSDIRIGDTSLYARVIVAGGGGSDGGAANTSSNFGGYGGGLAGQTCNSGSNTGTGGGGGTQTTPGTGTQGQAGAFGQGGKGIQLRYNQYGIYKYGGAGGGGWYGGAGVYPFVASDTSSDSVRGGGGGSGYVYTSSTAENYPSGCLLNTSCYLTDTSLIAGNASFVDYDGNTVTGHSGDGACRITLIA